MAEKERGDVKIPNFPSTGQVAIVDVVVSTLFDSTGRLRSGTVAPGAVAARAERIKIAHYSGLERLYHLIPFALESYGAGAQRSLFNSWQWRPLRIGCTTTCPP